MGQKSVCQLEDFSLDFQIAQRVHISGFFDFPNFLYYTEWLPRWSSHCKCDSRASGPGFDFRVGQNITGLFPVYRKISQL